MWCSRFLIVHAWGGDTLSRLRQRCYYKYVYSYSGCQALPSHRRRKQNIWSLIHLDKVRERRFIWPSVSQQGPQPVWFTKSNITSTKGSKTDNTNRDKMCLSSSLQGSLIFRSDQETVNVKSNTFSLNLLNTRFKLTS